MDSPEEQLMIFEKIDDEKIRQLFDLVDETIVNKPLSMEKMVNILDLDLDESERKLINNTLFNFSINPGSSNSIVKIIEKSKLTSDKKQILKESLKSIQDKLPEDKLSFESTKSFLEDVGHPHLHTIGVTTEFRPISKDGKITKILPSLIVTGAMHNQSHIGSEQLLNFQIDIETFEKMLKDFQFSLETIKEEVKDFKLKFGEDIID